MTTNRMKMIEAAATEATKALIDKGLLVEAGFAAFAHLATPKDTPPVILQSLQYAFMAGAEHLYSSIMSTLDEGSEPTADDLRRMDLIDAEIEKWRAVIWERIQPTKGSA